MCISDGARAAAQLKLAGLHSSCGRPGLQPRRLGHPQVSQTLTRSRGVSCHRCLLLGEKRNGLAGRGRAAKARLWGLQSRRRPLPRALLEDPCTGFCGLPGPYLLGHARDYLGAGLGIFFSCLFYFLLTSCVLTVSLPLSEGFV